MATLSLQTLNQAPLRLVASRAMQPACSRGHGENAPSPVSLLDFVDGPVLDIVYGWLSLRGVIYRSEQIPLRALKQKEGMDSLEPFPVSSQLLYLTRHA